MSDYKKILNFILNLLNKSFLISSNFLLQILTLSYLKLFCILFVQYLGKKNVMLDEGNLAVRVCIALTKLNSKSKFSGKKFSVYLCIFEYIFTNL